MPPRQRHRRWLATTLATFVVVALLAAGCGSDDAAEDAAAEEAEAARAQVETPALDVPPVEEEATIAVGPAPRVTFNQQFVEGVNAQAIDLEDSDAVFRIVFHSLPAEVTVYPSENYYYFILYTDGNQIWGNIRLPVV